MIADNCGYPTPERRPEAVQARLLAPLRHVQDAASGQVVDERQVLVPLPERLLIHPQIPDHFRLPPGQSPPYGTFHDPMDLVPTEAHLIGHGPLAGRSQPVDRQPLEQRRETTVRLGPGQTHHPNSMLRTAGTRRLGVEDRPVLARVQMPPKPLAVVVVQKAFRLALRACPRGLGFVPQIHMDFPLLKSQLHPLHTPRRGDTQNLLIQLRVLHGVPL